MANMRVVLRDYLQYCHDEIFYGLDRESLQEELTVIVSIDFLFFLLPIYHLHWIFSFHSTVTYFTINTETEGEKKLVKNPLYPLCLVFNSYNMNPALPCWLIFSILCFHLVLLIRIETFMIHSLIDLNFFFQS